MTDTQVMAALEPCPFCGSDRVTIWNVRDGQQAVCKDCRATAAAAFNGPADMPTAWERARQAWNRRAHSPAAEPESAWLIERSDIATVESDNRVCLHYYAEWGSGKHYWTPDHMKAKRFPTEDAAKAETNGDPLLTVAEHMWVSAIPITPPAGEADLCEHCGEYAHDCGGHPVAGDAKLRKALEKIATRLSAHPDDTPEDDRRGRHYAYSIATNALATLATPPSVPVQQGWLPIETAPKTGEPVLIWKPDERMVGEYMMVAYWSDDHLLGEPGWIPVGGVHKQGYASSVTGTPQGYPTHWMPLPATPPAQDQKGEEG